MHWLLDMHFGEDFCRVEDKNVQQNLNIIRKIVLNSIKRFGRQKVKFSDRLKKCTKHGAKYFCQKFLET